jgi:hypothetical protein
MTKYIIEGNINFKDELYKLLDEDSDNEDELCQITGLPLKDKYVVLECKHHFNYDALYKEIYKQKYEFKTYSPNNLTKTDYNKLLNSKLDYFIRCPYCRNMQFTILPYYEDLGLKEIYGINSLDKTLPNTLLLSNNRKVYYGFGHPDYTFTMFGVCFKKGECCQQGNFVGDKCKSQYVTQLKNTQLYYCKIHYKNALKNYNNEEKMKIKAAKLEAKQKKFEDRKKLLDDMNAERESKGLTLLKRLPVVKKKIDNVVELLIPSIKQYVPEDELEGCSATLKSGPNKGKQCGCKKTEVNGLCKRHSPKDKL